MTTRDEIAARLKVLVGLPFQSIGRSSDLHNLWFGHLWQMSNTRGRKAREQREIPEYALHVFCAWRFRDAEQILVGSRDRYVVIDGGETWDRPGANRCDARMTELIRPRLPTLVRALHVGELGAFSLELENEVFFDVLPDDSQDDEHWRFFQPYQASPHFFFENAQLRSE